MELEDEDELFSKMKEELEQKTLAINACKKNMQKLIIKFHVMRRFTDENIAQLLEQELSFVKETITNYHTK